MEARIKQGLTDSQGQGEQEETGDAVENEHDKSKEHRLNMFMQTIRVVRPIRWLQFPDMVKESLHSILVGKAFLSDSKT